MAAVLVAAVGVAVVVFGASVTADHAPLSVPAQAPRHAPAAGPLRRSSETLAAYSRRCQRMDRRGRSADVEWQSNKTMTRGETSTVALAVTLHRGAPPTEILGRAGAVKKERLIVACLLKARLIVPRERFTVDDDQLGWQTQSLETRDIATWIWELTPTATGSYTVVAKLQPVVRIKDLDGTARERLLREANTAPFPTTVHVVLPAADRPAWLIRWSKGRVDDLAHLLGAVAVLVGAASTLWLALRRFNKRRVDEEDIGTEPS